MISEKKESEPESEKNKEDRRIDDGEVKVKVIEKVKVKVKVYRKVKQSQNCCARGSQSPGVPTHLVFDGLICPCRQQ